MQDDGEFKPVTTVYGVVSSAVLCVFFWVVAVPIAIVLSLLLTWAMSEPESTRRWFTGGRPMRRLGHAFHDVVSGKQVSYFVDQFGRFWLAEHRWSIFRVRVDDKEI